jgi:hypothetical protein
LKCHFSKFVWIRGLKAKSADEAADELIKWLNDNGYISILACDIEGEFEGKVIEVCKQRGIKIIRGRPYHTQSQGSIEIANRTFERWLQAIRADTSIQSWMQLLPLIAWVINTTPTSALPKGNTPYEIWFGRKPPTNFQDHKESAWRVRTALGGGNESSASGESSTIEVIEREEDGEDSLFVDEGAEQEEAAEEMILSELTKRVAEHVRKQQEKMVKKANAKALECEAGRASERVKKRVAVEQARENGAGEGESGDKVGVRAPKKAKVTMGAPICSGRRGE